MSRFSSADVISSGAPPARRRAGSALAPRNWRVASRLMVLVAIPTVLGLALTGLRVTDAVRSAEAYGQVGRLAVLGTQVAGLTQAMEDERSGAATFISGGRPASGLPALRRQYAITDGWAARARRLVLRPGGGYPAQTRATAATLLAVIADLPGLRRRAAQSQAPALAVISGYSAAIADLLPVNDGIADLSGNSALITSVGALGSLSRMMDQATQQQAILRVALAEGRFEPGALTALTTAQARQAGDLTAFLSSATPEESRALSDTLASPRAGQAQALEERAIAAGSGPLDLGNLAGQQWWAGMSYTVGWMGHADHQLADWITAYAQALRRGAERSAVITGGAGLAALILVLLVTLMIARSVVRPLRRLAAAGLEAAGARLPAEVPALGTAGNLGRPPPVIPIDVLSADEIGQVALAFDRVHREAVRLAGEEARLRLGVGAVSAGFFLRSHSLLDRLLGLIDSLELSEDDPERLADLFQLDQLATRMRRASDSALIVAGYETARHSDEPFPLVDLLRAAVSEIEQYDQVVLDVQQAASVSGSAAADTVHLLAELLENAATFSPRWTQVVMSGHAADGGSLISITDDGTGLPEEQLGQLNWLLAHPPLADEADAEHMGLFAVAHLAARHGITVRLGMAPDGGTTAQVYLPAALISPDAQPGAQLDAQPGGWLGPAGEALGDGPEPPPELAAGPPVAVPLTLSAPVVSPAPATPSAVTGPEPAGAEPAGAEPAGAEPAGAEPGGVLPIFEAVESGYFATFGRGLLRPGDPQADQSTRAGEPAAVPASWAATADGGQAAAGTLAAGDAAAAGLPQRIPHPSPSPSPGRGAAADPASQPAPAGEPAELTRARLASFQRGSRRARADCGAPEPGQDG
jgi:signal transduction histidine kinase